MGIVGALFVAVTAALGVLFWIVLVQAILSWIPGLVTGSAWLGGLDRAVSRVTDPLLAPIRQRMPAGAVVDFSPLLLMIAIQVVRWVLGRALVG